jgi:hypothetical protein
VKHRPATFETAEVEQFLRDRKIGPLDGTAQDRLAFNRMGIKFDETKLSSNSTLAATRMQETGRIDLPARRAGRH